jgi:2-polyprenyl-6-methoxyphenol hydroxylase-like FAD-dependent oxidoreductase
MSGLKVAILGCGPAGLTAAIGLSAIAQKVVIFERFKAPTPVGSGILLQDAGMRVLRDLGIAQKLQARSQRLDRLRGMHGKRICLSVDYAEDAPAYAVHRAALHSVLFDEAQRQPNVEIRCDFRVAGLADAKRVVVSSTDQRSEQFDLIVDAMGSLSCLAMEHLLPPKLLPYGVLWANFAHTSDVLDPVTFPANQLTQKYYYASKSCGILPLGRPFEGDDTRYVAFYFTVPVKQGRWRDVAAFKSSVVRFWPELERLLEQQLHSIEQLTFGPSMHRTLPRSSDDGERVVFIGDSLKSTSPQLGQGATSAIIDAAALSAALAANVDSIPKALRQFERSRRDHITLYQGMSRLFTPMYQSESKALSTLRDIVVPIAAALPPTRALLARMVAGTLIKPIR